MAINPVSSVNNNIKNLSFGENKENTTPENKSKMTTQTKVLLGTALAALAATGIYIATRGKAKVKSNANIKENIVNEVKENSSQLIDESLQKIEFPFIVDLLKKFNINSDMEIAEKISLSEFKNLNNLFLHKTITLDNGYKLKVMKDIETGELISLARFKDNNELVYSLHNNWKTDCTTIKFENKECCYFRGSEKSMILRKDNKVYNYDSIGNFVSMN